MFLIQCAIFFLVRSHIQSVQEQGPEKCSICFNVGVTTPKADWYFLMKDPPSILLSIAISSHINNVNDGFLMGSEPLFCLVSTLAMRHFSVPKLEVKPEKKKMKTVKRKA